MLIRDTIEKGTVTIKVPDDLPQKFKDILKGSVTIPAAIDQWYFLAANNWWLPNGEKKNKGISDKTKHSYIARAKLFLKKDYTLPEHVLNPEASKKDDPTVIGLWTVEPQSIANPTPFDFWKTVRRLYSEYLIDASRFNGNTSPLSAIWAATLRKIYYDKTLDIGIDDFKTLGWMSQVYSSRDGLGVAAKNMTFELRTLQHASNRVRDNIMDYAEFKTLAQQYISNSI